MIELNLVLKSKWFDMIESGGKTEEYREVKPYWIRRFVMHLKPMSVVARALEIIVLNVYLGMVENMKRNTMM